MIQTPILEMQNLHVAYRSRGYIVNAVRGFSLTIGQSEAVGLVGESGSGKSTVARAALGLLPQRFSTILSGRILVGGRDMAFASDQEWQKQRGSPLAMVFQDPLSFLNPVMRIDHQIAEGVSRHDPRANVSARMRELLELVQMPQSAARAYPHELSGGMRQRVLLAIALGCRPRLLVADEPTTALDVTTQAEIIKLLMDIRTQIDVSVLLISHDLAVVAEVCQRIYVMYAGRSIERGTTDAIFQTPGHPYTYALVLAARAVRDTAGRFATIEGTVPSLADPSTGCPYVDRCPFAFDPCAASMPPALAVDQRDDHFAACFRVGGAASSAISNA